MCRSLVFWEYNIIVRETCMIAYGKGNAWQAKNTLFGKLLREAIL